MTTLRGRVRMAFAQPPVSFPLLFQDDVSKAVSHRGAVLHTPRDDKASLVVTMPADSSALVKRNTNLLIVLILASGWTERSGPEWLVSCMQSAAKRPKQEPYHVQYQGSTYTLLIDRDSALITLTVETTDGPANQTGTRSAL